VKSYGLTDKGAVRKDNQDCFILEKCEARNCLIAALCDGMGGAKAGGIASQLSNKAFVSYIFNKLLTRLPRNVDYRRILE
jgi:protein phosphatase